MMTSREILIFCKFACAFFLLFGFCLSQAVAQDTGPINTERPSFSSSPLALPTGYWQIEAGYQLTRNSGANDYSVGTGIAYRF